MRDITPFLQYEATMLEDGSSGASPTALYHYHHQIVQPARPRKKCGLPKELRRQSGAKVILLTLAGDECAAVLCLFALQYGPARDQASG